MQTTLQSGPESGGDAQTGGARWRENCRALYNYQRRDMRDALVQQKALYPKNWKAHVLRTLPFIWSLSREMATPYFKKPTRRWVGLDGRPLDPKLVKIIEAEYVRAKVNRAMRMAHRQVIALNNSTIWVWPDVSASGVSLALIPPHEQEVVMAKPFGLDEGNVASWRFRVPLPVPDDPTMSFWAVGHVTSTEAYWHAASTDLTGRGLYGTGKSNPYGTVPVVMLRGSDPGPGEWWAPVPEDLLSTQRALDHDYTDVGTVARFQAYGQPVVKSNSPTDETLDIGIETAVRVSTDGDFSYAQADPKLEGYVMQNREFLHTSVAMNGLNPASYVKTDGITAIAKQMERADRDTYREEQIEGLEQAEQRLYDVMRLVINDMRGVELWPEARVIMEYREPHVPADPLHHAQALQLLIAMEQTSPERARALQDGTTIEEARRQIEEERKARATQTPTPAPVEGEDTTTPAPEEGAETQTPAPDGPENLQAEGEVQKAALNGAQVAELRGTIQAVADGLLPAGSARAIILAAYPIAPADVDAMLSPLDDFEAKKPAPTVPFGAPPKPVEETADV